MLGKSLKFVLLIAGLLASVTLKAQLNTGDLAFVAFNADNNDGMAIVALAEIPANTSIFITDNNWNGTAFNTSEGFLRWDTGASAISTGTVTTFTSLNNSSRSTTIGTITRISGSFNMAADTEVVWVYLGTSATNPTTFLTAIANNGFSNLSGTGLTAGDNAVNIGGSADVAVYNGSTECTGTIDECRTRVNNAANWASQGGTGNQDVDAVFPDFPTDVPPNFGGSALPVELISFDGKIENGVTVLSWETASEIDNDYFEVQRSTDGVEFEAIGTVEGNGTSYQKNSYTYIDPDNFNAVSYYRLKQIDFDGVFEVFNIIRIAGAGNRSSEFTFYPNPATDRITLSNAGTVSSIAIYDPAGRKMLVPDLTASDGILDLSALGRGHYIMQVTEGQLSKSYRLVKR